MTKDVSTPEEMTEAEKSLIAVLELSVFCMLGDLKSSATQKLVEKMIVHTFNEGKTPEDSLKMMTGLLLSCVVLAATITKKKCGDCSKRPCAFSH